MPSELTKVLISPFEALRVLKSQGLVRSHSSDDKFDKQTATLEINSRNINSGDIFLAFAGVSKDAHDFLPDVISKKPSLIIVEDKARIPVGSSASYIEVSHGRKAWTYLCAKAFSNPQDQLRFIAVTGTNGKTSTVWHLRHLLQHAGHKVLSVGTLGAFIGDEFIPTTHTTPDPPVLYSLFRKAVDAGVKTVVMEASSHAIYQEKLAPLKVDVGIFTSFSRDHLDLHKTMEAYFAEKLRLFSELAKKDALFYASASLGESLEKLKSYRQNLTLYGFSSDHAAEQFGFPNYVALKLEATSASSGSTCTWANQSTKGGKLKLGVVGDFALENLFVAGLVSAKLLAKDFESFSFEGTKQVPGRLEWVKSSKTPAPLVLVDYAHTPDALEKALESSKPLSSGKLWVVFGCGGDRDRGKRPLMGKIAAELADHVVITSDNPRSEDPDRIINDILEGIDPKYQAKLKAEKDRANAISFALRQAKANDTILIAGKGHEDYMEIKGQRFPFDDRQVAREALNQV